MQRLKEKLSNLGKESNICLIYDIDADGMSSGSLIKHAFEKMGLGFKLELTDITRKAVLSEENQKKIKNAQIDCIVATDMSFQGLRCLKIAGNSRRKELTLLFLTTMNMSLQCRVIILC